MRCAHCGELALSETARYCIGCGAALPAASSPAPDPVESEPFRDPDLAHHPVEVDEEFVIRPRREFRIVPSERAVVIGMIAVIFMILLVIVVVTW